METIWMIQNAKAMGNWWLAASSQQCAWSCIISGAEFFVKHKITQVTQPHYSPDLASCDFWLLMRLRKTRWDSWLRLGELCEVLRCPLWRGLRHHCPRYNVSCIMYLLQQMSLFFILHGWVPSRQTSYTFPPALGWMVVSKKICSSPGYWMWPSL